MDNRIHDAFDAVRAEEDLKIRTKNLISERIRANTKSPRFNRLAVAVTCIFIMMLGFGRWKLYLAPVSAISVDINPSVELGVNRFDRVVSVKGYNNDGEMLASSVNLKNLKYTDALTVLLDSEAIAPYLDDNAFVSVTIIGSSSQKEEEMYSQLSSYKYSGAANVEYCYGNRELVDEAHTAGLSFGKYHVFLELQALDPDITTEDIQEWSMKQLRDRINELSDDSDITRNSNGRNGHGNQNQEKVQNPKIENDDSRSDTDGNCSGSDEGNQNGNGTNSAENNPGENGNRHNYHNGKGRE